MGDQLQSSDTLATIVAMFFDDKNALKRGNKLTINRSIIPMRSMIMQNNEGWASKTIKATARTAIAHINSEVEMGLIGSLPCRLDPEGILRGNYCVWLAFKAILEAVKDGKISKHPLMPRMRSRFRYSVESYLYRSGGYSTEAEKAKYRDLVMECAEEIASISTLEAALWELHKVRSDEHNSACQKAAELSKECDEEGDIISRMDYKREEKSDDVWLVKKEVADMEVIGPLVLIKIGKSAKGLVLTRVHFERLMKMMRSSFILAMSLHNLRLKMSPYDLILDMTDAWWGIIEEDTDFLGEVLKAARQILINKLDESYLSGDTPLTAYLAALTARRKGLARAMASKMEACTRSLEDAINLTNIFKIVPHPDTNMYELFATLEGVKTPNEVDVKMLDRFNGTLRRGIFSSLTALGVDPRIRATNDEGKAVEEMTAKTRRQDAALKQMSFNTWAATAFNKIENFVDIMDIEVAASSKSSQISYPFTEDDLINSSGYAAGILDDPPEFYVKARTVNDAASSLLGESELSPESAIRKFEKIIKLHEAFESKYPDMRIDEIPSQELEAFLMEEEGARYLVGTEPKFGEVHKKVTRMFYMAEQSLKSITQRVERYAKQVTRRQPGVSITKSYPARRRDLESFCRNMSNDPSGSRSIFVSFDMSEFSKKFPMELVRIYGQVLSELTGQEWLKRIDLVFRASVVIHNSRGFFAYTSGVRGGFEGFFNFVWSSIHSVIMEIALESTGLAGEILVFSDDGCLLFYAPQEMTDDIVWDKVQKIQKVYFRLGLNFHLGKSLISTHVWEYLGDVCYNNKLIPMWIKEVLSITRTMKNRGLEPFYTKIRSLQAQCDAVITAGGPPDVAYIVKRFLFGCYLDRLGIPYSPRLEELLCVIPSSCGGLRISSPFEAVTITTIEKDSEILADFVLMANFDRELAQVAISGIMSRTMVKHDISSAVIAGSRFNTDHPDTSGFSAINEVIDIIAERSSVPVKKSPLTREFGKNLKDVVINMSNVNLGMLSDFILSTPDWTEYTKSVSIVRSSGVLRLVPRGDIRRLQAADTRRVSDSILQWKDALRSPDMIARKCTAFDLVRHSADRVFRGVLLAQLRPSARLALSREVMANGIKVVIQMSAAPTLQSQAYAEPRIRLSADVTTIGWFAESTGDTELKSIRKFLDSAARFLSHSPESESALRLLSSLLGIDLPTLPPSIVKGGHRLGRARGRDVDCRTILPRWYEVGSEASYFGPIADALYKKSRSDRTTYLQCARAMSYYRGVADFSTTYPLVDQATVHLWYINDTLYDSMHNFKPMELTLTGFVFFPVEPISQSMVTEYIASYKESIENSERLTILMSSTVSGDPLSITERQMISRVYTNSLKRWLTHAYMHSNTTLLPASEILMPRFELVNMFRQAYCEATISIIDPRIRRKLLDLLNKHLSSLNNHGISLKEEVSGSDAFKEYMKHLDNLVNITSTFLPSHAPKDEIYTEVTSVSNIIDSLSRYCISSSLVGGPDREGYKQLTIVKGKTYAKGKVTPAHRSALREAFTSTLSYVLSVANEHKWNPKKIAKALNCHMNIDTLLTCLYLCRDLLRESHHRSTSKPYNQITSFIELYKGYRAIDEVHKRIADLEDSDTVEEDIMGILRGFRLSNIDKGKIVSRFMLTEKDRDHLAMLQEPVLETFMSRCYQMAKMIPKRKFYGVAARHGRWYHYTLDDVSRDLSSFYSAIIEPAINSVFEYSTELEEYILHEFVPDGQASFDLVDVSTTVTGIISNPCIQEHLSPRHRDVVTKLARRLLYDFLSKNMMSGVDTTTDSDKLVNIVVGEHIVYGGSKIDLWGPAVDADAEVMMYLLSSPTAEEALSDYINIAKSPGSSVTMIKDKADGVYYIIGFTRLYIYPDDGSYELEIAGIGSIDAITPTVRIAELNVADTNRLIADMTNFGRLTIDRNRFASAYSKLVAGFRQVNNISHILQAVVEEIKDRYTSSMGFVAYAVMLLYLKGEEDYSLVEPLTRKIVDYYQSLEGYRKTRLRIDIGLVTTWFKTTSIAHGDMLDTNTVVAIRRQISKISIPIQIPIGIIALKPANIVDIKGTTNESRITDMLGNVSSIIFIDEPVLAVGNAQEDLSIEGADRDYEASERLDDMW